LKPGHFFSDNFGQTCLFTSIYLTNFFFFGVLFANLKKIGKGKLPADLTIIVLIVDLPIK